MLSAYAGSVGLNSPVNSLGSHPCALPGEVSCAHRQDCIATTRDEEGWFGASVGALLLRALGGNARKVEILRAANRKWGPARPAHSMAPLPAYQA
jgi:hypothetical protein